MRKSLLFLVVAVAIGIVILASNTRAPWKHETIYEEVRHATEMTMLSCERAVPYVTGGKPTTKANTVTFHTVSTVETGGYRILLCID